MNKEHPGKAIKLQAKVPRWLPALRILAVAIAVAGTAMVNGGAYALQDEGSAGKASDTKAASIELVGEPVLIAGDQRYCHAHDIVQLASGELLVFYSAGASHLDPDNHIRMRRSDDHGATWGDPQVLLPPSGLAGYGLRDPHCVQLEDGTLVLSYFDNYLGASERGADLDQYVMRSEDKGETWSEPVLVETPLAWEGNSGKILVSPEGTLYLPIYGSLTPGAQGPEALGLAISNDGGRTWPEFQKIHEVPEYQGMETEFAILEDGTWVGLIRRTNARGGLRVVSEDSGKTWSEPEVVPVGHAPGLLVDGDMLIVNHRGDPEDLMKERYEMKSSLISVSLDGGKSFASTAVLSEPGYGGDCAYGNTVKLPEGEEATYFTTYYAPRDVEGYQPGKGPVAVFGQYFNIERTAK